MSPPIFSSLSEQDFAASGHDVHGETNGCQLFNKSKQLAGDVSSIITGELFPTTDGAIIFIIRITIYRLKDSMFAFWITDWSFIVECHKSFDSFSFSLRSRRTAPRNGCHQPRKQLRLSLRSG